MSDMTAIGGEQRQVVTFGVGGQEFATPILTVREIIRMMQITPVPHAPAGVEGLINLRGRVIAVVDLAARVGVASGEEVAENDQRIVVLEVAGRAVGFRVDKVGEVLRFGEDRVEPATGSLAGIAAEFVDGIAKLEDRLVILLDPDRLVGSETLRRLDAFGESEGRLAA